MFRPVDWLGFYLSMNLQESSLAFLIEGVRTLISYPIYIIHLILLQDIQPEDDEDEDDVEDEWKPEKRKAKPTPQDESNGKTNANGDADSEAKGTEPPSKRRRVASPQNGTAD